MPKRETALKKALMTELRDRLPGFVHQRHEDKFAVGWPDLSCIGFARTSYLEVKHATPNFDSIERQELTMLRLAAASFYARYLVYFENKSGTLKRTLIVHPKRIHDLFPEASTTGHDHRWVAEHILRIHRT